MVRHRAIALGLTEGDKLLLNVLDTERWRSVWVTGALPWSLQDLFWDDSGTICDNVLSISGPVEPLIGR